MKKILFASIALLSSIAFTSCDQDFMDGIAGPLTSAPETPQTVAFGNGSITEVATINLAEVANELVQVCQIKAPTVSDENAIFKGYTITIDNVVYDLSAEGAMSTEELTSIIEGAFGKRPVERAVEAVVRAYYDANGQSIVTVSEAFNIKAIPEAPEIEAAYYLTGTINGWDNTNTDYKLTNDGSDPYENPIFTCRIPAPEDGSDVKFKITPESGLGGDWSGCLAAGAEDGKFVYKNAGGDLVIPAVEGAVFYDLVFNMLDQTWEAKALLINIEPAYYFTGTLNGWNNNDTSYKLTNNGGDPYSNPTFTCRIPAPEDGGNIQFKMTPESGLGGDWSGCLAAGATPGTFVYNNGGGDFVIEAVPGAKYYDLTFNMMELTWSYKAVNFEQFVYFIGATDGWSASDQKVALVSEDGVYTGFLYVADPNGWGVEFKFQKVAGDWGDDSQLNSNNMNEVTGDFEKTGDNFKASAGEGVYFVTLDLAAKTLNGVKVNKMGIIGDFNGWGGDVEMTWNATDFCYEATGAGVNANGWKFRVNSDWGINLGGATLDDLVANGDNITVVGNTIKLYPTRKTSDKIYCTVE
ncbi:MAG: DUF5115 domain-containing protein [Prevotella sp.]|nr:DUF5115 domain-containing protein [Prevotella sp.]